MFDTMTKIDWAFALALAALIISIVCLFRGGAKGDVGDRGMPGPPGPMGKDGTDGVDGKCECNVFDSTAKDITPNKESNLSGKNRNPQLQRDFGALDMDYPNEKN